MYHIYQQRKVKIDIRSINNQISKVTSFIGKECLGWTNTCSRIVTKTKKPMLLCGYTLLRWQELPLLVPIIKNPTQMGTGFQNHNHNQIYNLFVWGTGLVTRLALLFGNQISICICFVELELEIETWYIF